MSFVQREGGWTKADVWRMRKNIREAFAAAHEMVGCGDPETFDEERERLTNARRMVLSFLADAERVMVKPKRKKIPAK